MALLLGLSLSEAAGATTYYINAPRFVRPLIEQWIEDYKKVAPDIDFAVAKTSEEKQQSELFIDIETFDADDVGDFRTVWFGKYAVLPVVSKNSEAAAILQGQEWNHKRVKQLFFVNEDYEEGTKKDKRNIDIVVYTGSSPASVSNAFAHSFGKDPSSFKGRRIVGDDQFLTAAIAKDSYGLTINTIPNIYNLETRSLQEGLTLLPIAAHKQLKSLLAEASSLDKLLTELEGEADDLVPTGRVGLRYSRGNDDIASFLSWVITEGKALNHRYGLLGLDDKTLAQQAQKLSGPLTAQK